VEGKREGRQGKEEESRMERQVEWKYKGHVPTFTRISLHFMCFFMAPEWIGIDCLVFILRLRVSFSYLTTQNSKSSGELGGFPYPQVPVLT
jgi:hypothetical protein